eukprot:CAMPEP_0118951038 /NCGR_PEP_ID=MMETSP1169-20130426/52410_1 /TAXON_ID=36882 /ORGANISM="Pyramimonas obovata, Strain CCMP722" /LENGTH=74 /DNA_ID=CAMNT_0006898005 /DNA_START=345 /DNA_END=565 /DNA_ORIENTATION=-
MQDEVSHKVCSVRMVHDEGVVRRQRGEVGHVLRRQLRLRQRQRAVARLWQHAEEGGHPGGGVERRERHRGGDDA